MHGGDGKDRSYDPTIKRMNAAAAVFMLCFFLFAEILESAYLKLPACSF